METNDKSLFSRRTRLSGKLAFPAMATWKIALIVTAAVVGVGVIGYYVYTNFISEGKDAWAEGGEYAVGGDAPGGESATWGY